MEGQQNRLSTVLGVDNRVYPVIIVPPFVGDASVPNLGVALIEGQMRERGIPALMLDMNIEFLNSGQFGPVETLTPDNRRERFEAMLVRNGVQEKYLELAWRAWLDHEDVAVLMDCLSREKCDFRCAVQSHLSDLHRPHFVAIAVTVPQQLVLALAIARACKLTWSDCPVILGGPHIDLLATKLESDAGYLAFFDFYVTGRTHGALLEAAQGNANESSGLCIPGRGKCSFAPPCPPPTLPVFSSIGKYTCPVVPFSLSKGCPYSRCTFCTRPIAEGRHTGFDLTNLEYIISICQEHDATLWLIDCEIPPEELLRVSEVVNGRVKWKCYLHARGDWDKSVLLSAYYSGLRSVEIGVEALDEGTQALFDKTISFDDIVSTLRSIGSTPIEVDVNYIIDSPCRDEATESFDIKRLEAVGSQWCPDRFKISRFPLDLFCGTKLWRDSEKNGMRIVREFEYANTCEWSRMEMLK